MSYEGRWRLTEALHGIAHLVTPGSSPSSSGTSSPAPRLCCQQAIHHQDPEKLWRFHDAPAALRGQITADGITAVAREVGVDPDVMWARIDSGVDEPKVIADAQDVDGLTEDGNAIIDIDGKRFDRILNRWTFSEALSETELGESEDEARA